jgi:ABC-type polysaccharide/polyol phosphate export permease
MLPPLPPSDLTHATGDLWRGAWRWELWGALAWQDIRLRYRRSIVGPFWLTISMGLMVGGLGVLYAGIFRQNVHDYLPFLALGLITWGLVSSILTEGCNAFIGGERFIKQLPAPLSVHVYRVIWRNLIVFGHNLVIYLVVALVFQIWPGWLALQVVPGLLLLLAIGIWLALLLGVVSARFRDVPPIVGSVVQFLFFLTPIFWSPDLLPERMVLVSANPFYHMIEVVRAPLLGKVVALETWLALSVVAVAGGLFSLLFFSYFRRRVAYWV